jgi:hypothetical protein
MTNLAVIPMPVKAVRVIRIKRGRMVILTPPEMLALLKAARKRSIRDWAMILLAYRHGLRASEVCGIKMADMDLKSGSISIRRLKGSLHTIQPLYQHRGQPLLDESAAIRAWLHKRTADGSDYLFTSQKGGKLDRTQFFRNFQKVAESCWAFGREAAPACPEALPGVTLGRRERQPGVDSTGLGPSVHLQHHAIYRYKRCSGGGGAAKGANGPVLMGLDERNKISVVLHCGTDLRRIQRTCGLKIESDGRA